MSSRASGTTEVIEEWLVKYKFKDWAVTETNQTSVTDQMKKDRAKEIADKLNDVRRWNSHGIGINMELLRKELNLKIDDFGQNKELSGAVRRYHSGAVRRYHRLLVEHAARMKHTGVVHTRQACRGLKVR